MLETDSKNHKGLILVSLPTDIKAASSPQLHSIIGLVDCVHLRPSKRSEVSTGIWERTTKTIDNK